MSLFCKVVLYTEIAITSVLTNITYLYMSLDSSVENCLSNMAALLVLNEIDTFIGNFFELRVKKKLPKLTVSDEYLKDEVSFRSQNIAVSSAYFP